MPNIRILTLAVLKISYSQGFSIAIMAESKGHNLVNTSQNSLESKSDHLNIDPDLYVKYQNPSSRGSQDIVVTIFLYCYNGRVEKGAQSSQYFTGLAPKLIRSSKY